MERYTEEQILEKYRNLPEDLKGAIFSVEMAKTIKDIGDKHKLEIDKIGVLGNETGMVMIGFTHPKDFISNLAQRLKVDKEKAREIAQDVNMQIFAKVRESLKKMHGEDVPAGEIKREEILREIEKEELPPILRGTTGEVESPHPFEAKTKEGVFRMEPLEKKYPSGDPYREQI